MRESALSSPITVSNLIVTICVLIISLLLVPYKVFAMGITKRVSVSSRGTQANDGSFFPSISSDGRYIAFRSLADNLVDTKGSYDIFVHDLQTAQTSRVSISSTGVPVNGSSNIPSISSDGRYIAFQSWATNLVVGDTNDSVDIFVYDRQTGQTTRASVSSTGEQGNMDSIYASISANGRYVAFNSYANNIVDGDTNLTPDFFVHDRQTGQTTRVSVPSTGAQGQGGLKSARGIPSISSDGRYVAFESYANNLVDGDTNDTFDIFVHDRQSAQTTRVSVSSTGVQGNGTSHEPSISSDGRYVAFNSYAGNIVDGDTKDTGDVFVHDRQTGHTTQVNVSSTGVQGNSTSHQPSISSDGRYVAFSSTSDNLVDGDTNGDINHHLGNDIFVHDRQTGQTTRVSVSSKGLQANEMSVFPSISSDGRYIAFYSLATNLVVGDTNDSVDIFVHNRQAESVGLALPCTILLLLGN